MFNLQSCNLAVTEYKHHTPHAGGCTHTHTHTHTHPHPHTMFGPVMIVRLELEDAYCKKNRGRRGQKVRGYRGSCDVRCTYHIIGYRLVVDHFIKHWVTTSLDAQSVWGEFWTHWWRGGKEMGGGSEIKTSCRYNINLVAQCHRQEHTIIMVCSHCYENFDTNMSIFPCSNVLTIVWYSDRVGKGV